MPDGNQGPSKPSHLQTSTSPQPFDIPGVDQARRRRGPRHCLCPGHYPARPSCWRVVVFGLQAVMPEGSKPSDLIGSFHGATESAELKAKQETATEYERRMADAKAAPPANWQMESRSLPPAAGGDCEVA